MLFGTLRTMRMRRRHFSSSFAADRVAITLSNCSTLHELGVMAGRVFKDRPSLGVSTPGVGWTWTTFAERAEKAKQCTSLLRRLGVQRGERVAVISKNRLEWATCAYGTYGAGAAFVPCYEQQLPSEWEYILRDSGSKVLFVSRKDLLENALRAAEASKTVQEVLCFDDEDGEHSFAKAMTASSSDDASSEDMAPSASDLATLIYTSGTSGEPKGVELTHGNVLWNCVTAKDLSYENFDRFENPPKDVRSLSILPWAHIFGQTCELHGLTAMGAQTALATDPTTFLAQVEEVKPTIIMAVPALYNRIYDGFAKAKGEMPGWKRSLTDRALGLGEKKAKSRCGGPSLSLVERTQLSVLDSLVLSKVRAKLGGNVAGVASGGAAIASEVRIFLEAVGLVVYNGYGLTETSPVLTSERITDAANFTPGSIGKPLPSVDVRALDENGDEVPRGQPGELVISSPGLMRGYWNRPEITAEVVFEKDGTRWFRTGDQGCVEADGHVRIVGRIKEKYKLANGKYVVPTPLEESFARSPYISQVFLYGDNKPHNVALVAPDWAAVDEHLSSSPSITMIKPFEFGPQEAIDRLLSTRRKDVEELVAAELDKHNPCKSYEFPAKWTVIDKGFNVARGMLTPKMSLRRNVVLRKHQHDIDSLYDAAEEDQRRTKPKDSKAANATGGGTSSMNVASSSDKKNEVASSSS